MYVWCILLSLLWVAIVFVLDDELSSLSNVSRTYGSNRFWRHSIIISVVYGLEEIVVLGQLFQEVVQKLHLVIKNYCFAPDFNLFLLVIDFDNFVFNVHHTFIACSAPINIVNIDVRKSIFVFLHDLLNLPLLVDILLLVVILARVSHGCFGWVPLTLGPWLL